MINLPSFRIKPVSSVLLFLLTLALFSCNNIPAPCNCAEAFVNGDFDFVGKCEKHFETLNEAQKEEWLEIVYNCEPSEKSTNYNKGQEKSTTDNTLLAEEFNESGKNKAKSGDFEGALDDFSNAISLNTKSEVYYSNRGNVKRLLNRFDQAIDDLSIAILLNPSYSSAYLNRGLAFIESGYPSEGCNDIKEAINLGDSSAKRIYDKYCYN